MVWVKEGEWMDCTGTRSLKIPESIRAQGMSLVINEKRGRRLLTVKSRNSDREDDEWLHLELT